MQNTGTAATRSDQGSGTATTPDYAYDLRKEFFIDESPSLGPVSFPGTKADGAGGGV